jgi:hypothetical protein
MTQEENSGGHTRKIFSLIARHNATSRKILAPSCTALERAEFLARQNALPLLARLATV